MVVVNLTPYEMEIVASALKLFRKSENVVATSSEDVLRHLDSLARRFEHCDEVHIIAAQG